MDPYGVIFNFIRPDGSLYKRYEGQYKVGNKHGTGTQTWLDDSKYHGDWVENKMTGKGTYSINFIYIKVY